MASLSNGGIDKLLNGSEIIIKVKDSALDRPTNIFHWYLDQRCRPSGALSGFTIYYCITRDPSHRTDPVFLKARPRGLGFTDEAMAAQALSEYIQRRCYDFGIISPSSHSRPTLYAWRRSAGTKVHRQYGLDRTSRLFPSQLVNKIHGMGFVEEAEKRLRSLLSEESTGGSQT